MFDFQKAINGEPIYLRYEQVFPIYMPHIKQWAINQNRYDDLGNYFGYGPGLSTDQPKKKVMVTAYVYKNSMGVPFVSNEKLDDMLSPIFLGEKQFEVEI
jgi:hypothetical protein